jgi:hypothetical protein
VLQLPTLIPELSLHAERLGVARFPTPELAIVQLEKHKPSTQNAITIFTFLTSMMSSFSRRHWEKLRDLSFIPITRKLQNGETEVVYAKPGTVYFGAESEESYPDLFDYVDFGSGNAFLKACGVREQPSASDLAHQVLQNPEQFLSTCTLERYLAVLRQLALHAQAFAQSHKSLFKKMKGEPFLVAYRKSEDETSEFRLLSAKEIYIVDDTVIQQIFNPWTAPMESLLEAFYLQLGSVHLSSEVKESWRPSGQAVASPTAASLQDLIRARAPLLLYDMDLQSSAESSKSDGMLDVLRNLEVMEVRQIELQRSLGSQRKTQLTTAAWMSHTSKRGALFLLIVGDFDYFDVAQILNRAVLKRGKLNDALLLSTLLSTSLEHLKRKGFPVDRLLTPSRPASKVAVRSEPKDLPPDPQQASSPPANARGDSNKEAPIMRELQSIFPDCDPDYLMAVAEQYGYDVAAICDRLLGENYPKKTNPSASDSSQQEPELPMQRSQSQNSLRSKTPLLNNLKDLIGSIGSAASSTANQQLTSTKPVHSSDLKKHQAMLNESLKRAITNCSGTSSSQLITPPREVQASSTAIHCETIPGQNLTLIATVTFGRWQVPFFAHRQLNPTSLAAHWNGTSTSHEFRAFSSLLRFLGESVFRVQLQAIHIYLDLEESETVAFNSGGSLFFNLRFFVGMHAKDIKAQSSDRANELLPYHRLNRESVSFWFMTFCHELAHNFVSMHDTTFAFYLSSFARQYMSTLMEEMQKAGIEE